MPWWAIMKEEKSISSSCSRHVQQAYQDSLVLWSEGSSVPKLKSSMDGRGRRAIVGASNHHPGAHQGRPGQWEEGGRKRFRGGRGTQREGLRVRAFLHSLGPI